MLASLPPTWESSAEFWVAGFGPFLLLVGMWEVNQQVDDLSLSFPALFKQSGKKVLRNSKCAGIKEHTLLYLDHSYHGNGVALMRKNEKPPASL